MKRLEKIIKDERNVGLDFIVHIQNENELNDLINVLTRCNFEIQFALEYSPDELKRWIEDIGKDNNFDVCFVCTAEDFQSSLEITSMLKELGASFVVSTAKRERQADLLKKIGLG